MENIQFTCQRLYVSSASDVFDECPRECSYKNWKKEGKKCGKCDTSSIYAREKKLINRSASFKFKLFHNHTEIRFTCDGIFKNVAFLSRLICKSMFHTTAFHARYSIEI